MAKGSQFFIDKDTGYSTLMTQFKGSKGRAVFAGLLRSSGSYDRNKVKHVKKDGKPAKRPKNQPAITMAQIAAVHEFGSKDGTIPERSFMRSSIDRGAKEIEAICSRLLKNLGERKIDETGALHALGLYLVKLMKQTITNQGPGFKGKAWKQIKKETSERKGGKTSALIDTGQLLNSIDYEVVEAGKK